MQKVPFVAIAFILCFSHVFVLGQSPDDGRIVKSLNGVWQFKTDPERTGEGSHWFKQLPDDAIRVQVPHTWNVMEGFENYRGQAWYATIFDIPLEWSGRHVRLKFAAVYRDVTIYVNGIKAGQHLNSGYTTFFVDVSSLLKYGASNTLTLSVDNSFSETALPYKDSFDWSNDGGIIRPVELIVSDRPSLRYVHVTPIINFTDTSAQMHLNIRLWETNLRKASFDIVVREWKSGTVVAERTMTLRGREGVFSTSMVLSKVSLWHFDNPFLYEVEVKAKGKDGVSDHLQTRFGFRKVVLEGDKLLVNNEPVRLPGIEYMPSSHPQFGSAEPRHVMDSVVYMLKDLNAVITRFHWQVDEYLLDRFDEEGILVQAEIPWWQQPGKLPPAVMETAKLQLSGMIERDFNHPSIFSWGISNEVFSTDSAQFYLLRDFTKSLDTTRLTVVVSNETFKRLKKDESLIADLPTWNDYVGTWYGDSSRQLPSFLATIESALDGRPLLITESGLCEPRFAGGDLRRIDDMIYHYNEWAKRDYIVGCIYFSLNDYRTHRGEDGADAFEARIHGVTDLYFNRKPSYYVFKQLAAPIQIRNVRKIGRDKVEVHLFNKNSLPSYAVRGYRVVWNDTDGKQRSLDLPTLGPGEELKVVLEDMEKRFSFDVISPGGYQVTGYPLAWEAAR